MADSVCECVECCDGEHAGFCAGCAGWGEEEGNQCEKCEGTGVCPKCNGAAGPVEEPDDGEG